jgi:hypothetical protein
MASWGLLPVVFSQKHEPLSLRNRLEMPFSLSPPYQSLGEHNPEELLVGADVLW